MKARARHILVKNEQSCQDLKNQIDSGGDLGEFSPGQMVREFDDVVFNQEVGKTHGPVRTQFGFHLIEIVSRGD